MVPNPRAIFEIVDKFPIKTLPKFEGDPKYKAINKLMHLLYNNMENLPTP